MQLTLIKSVHTTSCKILRIYFVIDKTNRQTDQGKWLQSGFPTKDIFVFKAQLTRQLKI